MLTRLASTSSCVALLVLSLSRQIVAQTAIADTADVRTVGDIVRASYEATNHSAGVPPQWRRTGTLYAPRAVFVFARERAGMVRAITRSLEDIQRRLRDSAYVARGAFETEIGRHIERFGDVAEVRSVSVLRRTRGGPIDVRYVNYLQLYWDGDRWWIAGVVFDEESPNAPIPSAWIGRIEDPSTARVSVRP